MKRWLWRPVGAALSSRVAVGFLLVFLHIARGSLVAADTEEGSQLSPRESRPAGNRLGSVLTLTTASSKAAADRAKAEKAKADKAAADRAKAEKAKADKAAADRAKAEKAKADKAAADRARAEKAMADKAAADKAATDEAAFLARLETADASHADPEYAGQCVTLVKNARPELAFKWGNGYGEPGCDAICITKRREATAKEMGFEVNGIPMMGAAFLVNVRNSKGGLVAHTGIILSAKPKKVVTKRDLSSGEITERSIYDVETIESNRYGDLKVGRFRWEVPEVGWRFIHEKKEIYDAKQKRRLNKK